MSTIRHCLVLVALLGAALSGCSSTPRFNEHFGASVRANVSAQVIDPAATASVDPVLGISGTAARAAQERYERSFKDPDSGNKQSLIGGGRSQ